MDGEKPRAVDRENSKGKRRKHTHTHSSSSANLVEQAVDGQWSDGIKKASCSGDQKGPSWVEQQHRDRRIMNVVG